MAKKKASKKANAATENTVADAAAVNSVTVLSRSFEYAGMKLEDPGTDKSVPEVRDFYSQHYPELVNADIKGPVTDKGVEKWQFVKRLAPKG